jgi:hypothetical protein
MKVLTVIKSTNNEAEGVNILRDLLEVITNKKLDITRAVTKKGHTFLIEAVIKNKANLVEILIDHSKSVKQLNNFSYSDWVNMATKH